MRWLRRLSRRKDGDSSVRIEWRRRWADALETPDDTRIDELRASMERAVGPEDEGWEIEREMLEGLRALASLVRSAQADGLPAVATGHRAAGTDVCHFTAKVSLPDDPAHPAGTLLLTRTRLVFIGGARGITVPWHALGACIRQDRDLVIGRADRRDTWRIRFNSYADVLQATWLARQLARRTLS